jgi:hypothetical protein
MLHLQPYAAMTVTKGGYAGYFCGGWDINQDKIASISKCKIRPQDSVDGGCKIVLLNEIGWFIGHQDTSSI